jgi:hypothetical protein
VHIRSIYLLDLWKRQLDLASIIRSFRSLTRVALEINCLKCLDLSELRLERVQGGDLVIIQPEFLEFSEVRKVFKLRDEVIRYVQCSEVNLIQKLRSEETSWGWSVAWKSLRWPQDPPIA